MFWYNLKIIFRNLVKNKLYSFLSITGFAIGFAVCVIIALYTYNEYTVDHCFPGYKNIYRLTNAKKKKCLIDYKLNEVLASNNPEIVLACPVEIYPYTEFNVKSEDRRIKAKGIAVTNNHFFKLFTLKTVRAISEKPFTDKNSAVITESLAKKLFKKDEDPLGKPINVFNLKDATISAIVEDIPANSSLGATVFLNSDNKDFFLSSNCVSKCINPVGHYILLNDKVNAEDFICKLNRDSSLYSFAVSSIGIQKITDIYLDQSILDSRNNKGDRNLILIYLAVGTLIIFLSIINYLNYNMSMQYTRLKEIGIKRVNGAGKRHLFGYYITEVSVSMLISFDIALVIVAYLLPQINNLLGKQLSLNYLFSIQMILFLIGSFVLITLINSFVPFYLISKFNINSIFAGKQTLRHRLPGRNILTTFQFIVAITLLASVFIIQKQLYFEQKSDMGFSKKDLLRLVIPNGSKNQKLLKDEIDKFPFVINSSLSFGVPGLIHMWNSGGTPDNPLDVGLMFADRSFYETLKISFVEGDFNQQIKDKNTCIINEEAKKMIGCIALTDTTSYKWGENKYKVIGVVKNFHFKSFRYKMDPLIILPTSPDDLSGTKYLSIRITPGEVKQKLTDIEKAWKKVYPDDSIDHNFYENVFDAMYRKDKLLATIIMFFSIVAIVLSCMGILGQVFQSCISRTKEIGIRKVNGATSWIVIRLLNFDFVKLVLVAFAISTPVSYYFMSKWLQNFAYKTEMSWWVFLLAGLVILAISFVTVTWHSWRTASRNPIEALRYE